MESILQMFTAEIESVTTRQLWKDLFVYEKLIKSVENLSINTGYVMRYFSWGNLTDNEMIAFSETEVLYRCVKTYDLIKKFFLV